MNPLTYISNISRNKQSNVEKISGEQSFCKSPEIVAIFVFAGIYVIIRLIESYVIPLIPEFLTREISALFRWGPILVPIIFGITYFSKKSKTNNKNKHNTVLPIKDTSDDVLKKRMMSWTR